ERLRDRFIETFGTVTPGMSIMFGHGNQSTREVTVLTDDGEVPIELISQGSVSLRGWIGVLMQRLCAICGEDETAPTKRYALVEAILNDQIGGSAPEARQPLLDKARELLDEVAPGGTTRAV